MVAPSDDFVAIVPVKSPTVGKSRLTGVSADRGRLAAAFAADTVAACLATLPLGLVNFTSNHSTNYPELFAALSIATLPVVLVYIVAQRQFISGMTAGALKG